MKNSRGIVVRPKNLREVQKYLRRANKQKIPIYPVSTNKNWGYGAFMAKKSILMELSGMDKVVDYNEKLAYVTIEPGVTFKKLYEFLAKKKSNLTISTIGGSPDSSLIGNISERGIGKGVYGNMYENIANLEVVMPTGEVINTGFGNFGLDKLASISREGVGPEITGLFTQSNFGVITKLTLWLHPKPKYSQLTTFHANTARTLEKIIDAIRVLKLEGTIEGNFLIANEIRALSCYIQYPWKEMDHKTPLSSKQLEKIKKRLGFVGKWVGQFVLGASSKMILKGKRERIREVLGKITPYLYFNDQNDPFEKPSDFAIRSCYWRKKTTIPKVMDPERDGCGMLWVSPVVPFIGRDISIVVKFMEKIMIKYGFEANVGINCITDRKLYIIGSIVYDKDVKEEHDRALKCNKEILEGVYMCGYFPYRLNNFSGNKLLVAKDGYKGLLRNLKKMTDPKNILAPERYQF